MSAREWFETIRSNVVEMRDLEREIEGIETQSGPHGQSAGSIGGGGSHDSLRGIDHLVDSRMREKLERQQTATNAEIERALEVLYGKSGRGGLARAKSSTDADILCCYYLQGMEWPDIAGQVSRGDVARPNGWCRTRAMRALAYIDRVGIAPLTDS